MKSMLTRFSAVAALALSAVSLQAEPPAQKVDVNFGFRTPAGEHAPGRYRVEVRYFAAGAQYISMTNEATRQSVLFNTQAPMQKLRSEERPRLVFKCGGAGCDLAEVWNDPHAGATIRRNKKAPADAERTAVTVTVPMTTKAD